MTLFSVNATLSVPAWVTVEADTPGDAVAEAMGYRATDFDYDVASATVDFNVTPLVEEE